MGNTIAPPPAKDMQENAPSEPKYDPRYPSGEGWFTPIDDNHTTGCVPIDYPKGTPVLPRILP